MTEKPEPEAAPPPEGRTDFYFCPHCGGRGVAITLRSCPDCGGDYDFLRALVKQIMIEARKELT